MSPPVHRLFRPGLTETLQVSHALTRRRHNSLNRGWDARTGGTNRRTTLTVVAGVTCCSPQPGWPGRGRRQGDGVVWLDPRPRWRCSLTMAAVHRIHGNEHTVLAKTYGSTSPRGLSICR